MPLSQDTLSSTETTTSHHSGDPEDTNIRLLKENWEENMVVVGKLIWKWKNEMLVSSGSPLAIFNYPRIAREVAVLDTSSLCTSIGT